MQSGLTCPSAEQVDLVVALFTKQLDVGRSGKLRVELLVKVLQNAGLTTFSEAELRNSMQDFCTEASSRVDYVSYIHWLFGPVEAVLKRTFEACDVTNPGRLSTPELQLALKACGLLPTSEQLASVCSDLHVTEFDIDGFSKLQAHMQRDAGVEKAFPCVPHARRGLTLKQLQSIYETFVRENWLRKECDDYNAEHRKDIDNGTSFAYDENLYALDHFLVRKVTHPEQYRSVPEELRRKASLPEPKQKCSFAELLNPAGVIVHFFVSHYWGHLFLRTLKSLEAFAASRADLETSAIVFWICLFALNQHKAAQEVGSSPEEGPFNAALAKATCGVVMVLDEMVHPLKRIWCLFEVQRTVDFSRRLTILGEAGHLAEEWPARRCGAPRPLVHVAAAAGGASCCRMEDHGALGAVLSTLAFEESSEEEDEEAEESGLLVPSGQTPASTKRIRSIQESLSFVAAPPPRPPTPPPAAAEEEAAGAVAASEGRQQEGVETLEEVEPKVKRKKRKRNVGGSCLENVVKAAVSDQYAAPAESDPYALEPQAAVSRPRKKKKAKRTQEQTAVDPYL